jgi:hypothetical protein
VAVVLAGEELCHLLLGEHLLRLGEAGLYLSVLGVGGLLLGKLGQRGEVLGLGQQLPERLDLALPAGDLGVQLLRRLGIIPEVGSGGALFQLLQLGLAPRKVKDVPSVLALD